MASDSKGQQKNRRPEYSFLRSGKGRFFIGDSDCPWMVRRNFACGNSNVPWACTNSNNPDSQLTYIFLHAPDLPAADIRDKAGSHHDSERESLIKAETEDDAMPKLPPDARQHWTTHLNRRSPLIDRQRKTTEIKPLKSERVPSGGSDSASPAKNEPVGA